MGKWLDLAVSSVPSRLLYKRGCWQPLRAKAACLASGGARTHNAAQKGTTAVSCVSCRRRDLADPWLLELWTLRRSILFDAGLYACIRLRYGFNKSYWSGSLPKDPNPCPGLRFPGRPDSDNLMGGPHIHCGVNEQVYWTGLRVHNMNPDRGTRRVPHNKGENKSFLSFPAN
jgi:hypothetical protein